MRRLGFLLGAAGVCLDGAGGRHGRRGLGTGGRQAATQEQLLVFTIQVEYLQRTLAGALEEFPAMIVGGARMGAQLGQAGVEAGREGLLAFTPGGVRGMTELFENAVFLQAELVELVTQGQVAGEDFGETHGCVIARGGVAGRKAWICSRVATAQESWEERQVAMRTMSARSAGGGSPASFTICA